MTSVTVLFFACHGAPRVLPGLPHCFPTRLSSDLWGIAAGAEGLAAALCAAGAVQVVCALIGLRFPRPSTSGLNLELVSRWTAPDLAVEIQQRSGRSEEHTSELQSLMRTYFAVF